MFRKEIFNAILEISIRIQNNYKKEDFNRLNKKFKTTDYEK